MVKKILFFIFFNISFTIQSQVKILFDATKAEMAGSADWVIDADAHNLYTSNPTSGITVNTGGTESNPQRIPLPAQSGITSTTPESYWQGAISHWAIDCARQGYIVESLPWNARITYGDLTNGQDLSNYKVFIVDEPNILFTTIEKNAIVNFVKNGGGLMMIADHTISDRNNDTFDSLMVWNDLMTTNTVLANPFGISFDSIDLSQTTSNVKNLPNNTILHGPASPIVCSVCGNVTQVKWSSGTTMTLSPAANPTVTGLIYKTGSSTTGTLNAMCASSTYLAGKVIAIGDSSIADDSTGDSNDVLYDGYIADASGNHQKLLMNATIWLATNSTMDSAVFEDKQDNSIIVPNPISDKELRLFYKSTTNSSFIIYDSIGREVKRVSLPPHSDRLPEFFDCTDLISGFYIGKIQSENSSKSIPFSVN